MPSPAKKTMKVAMKQYKRGRAKNHLFTNADIALVKDKMEQGLGYRRIYDHFVTERRRGKMPWSIHGVKALVKRLAKGDGARKKGQGAKRSKRTADLVEKVRKYVEANPTSGDSSINKVRKKFGLSAGTAVRVLKQDLGTKSLRRVKTTRLSSRRKEMRVKFAKSYIAAVDNKKIDPDSVFWSDEKLFQGGVVCSNPHNDRVRVPIGAKKSGMRPSDICKEHDGKWGTVRIMGSMAISKIGTTPPSFVPKGIKISGETYLDHIENNLFPSMAALAAANGKQRAFSFMQDGASAHKVAAVLKSIKKNTWRPFGLDWPSKSPDLNPCDFFLWGAMQAFIDGMPTAPRTEAELKAAVHLAAASISKETIAKAVDQVYDRCQKVIEHEGARFEYALKKKTE